jgi:hypothetical protein
MHLAGGAAIFGIFIVVYFVALVYGLYTRRGSAINQRPYNDQYGNAPAAARRSRLSHDAESFANYRRGTR